MAFVSAFGQGAARGIWAFRFIGDSNEAILRRYGDTFVVGHAPERQACADAARALFGEVADAWRTQGLSGQALYAFAGERAAAMGWRLNHAVKGHRVSDFPHAIHKGGDLGDLEASPSSGLWILEIQIAHPSEPFGAFCEDLLTR